MKHDQESLLQTSTDLQSNQNLKSMSLEVTILKPGKVSEALKKRILLITEARVIEDLRLQTFYKGKKVFMGF